MEWGELLEVGPLDFILLALLAVLVYRWWRRKDEPEIPIPVRVPPLPKQDFTLETLRKYDGIQDPHILFAVDGVVFDVTRGKNFYGPEGPYGKLAGHDATRALATMDASANEWDDVSDLPKDEVDTMQEWKSSFKYKYYTVGRLIKDDETPKDYEGKISEIEATTSLQNERDNLRPLTNAVCELIPDSGEDEDDESAASTAAPPRMPHRPPNPANAPPVNNE